MLSFRSLLGLLFLFALVGFTSWFALKSSEPIRSKLPKDAILPVSQVSHGQWVQMTPQGALQYVVKIDQGVEYNNQHMDFESGFLTAYQDPGTPPWKAFGAKGSYNRPLQILDLKQQVTLDRAGFGSTPPLVFATTALSINLKTHQVQTTAHVLLTEPGSLNQTQAIGMQANLKTHTVHLDHQVRSTYDPLVLSDIKSAS